MSRSEIERVGDLLRELPPPPEGWVHAAQELPRARAGHDAIVARAAHDAEFHRALASDLDAALAAEGYVPAPPALEALRKLFATGG